MKKKLDKGIFPKFFGFAKAITFRFLFTHFPHRTIMIFHLGFLIVAKNKYLLSINISVTGKFVIYRVHKVDSRVKPPIIE